MKRKYPTREEREKFIIEYLKIKEIAGCFEGDFHEAYSRKFPMYEITQYLSGPSPVKMAMKDLRRMYQDEILDRYSIGNKDMPGPGWPKWVYVYRLNRWYR